MGKQIPSMPSETTSATTFSTTKSSDGRIVVGIDEAGYGPNIGPLLIAATAWRIPLNCTESSFTERLSQYFSNRPWSPDCEHIPLGDSKQLYSPSTGLRTLAAGLLAMHAQLGENTTCFESLLSNFISKKFEPGHPWYERLPGDFPARLAPAEIERLASMASMHLEQCGVELLLMRALVITESEFNAMLDRLGSKGRLLSTVTMRLVAGMIDTYCQEPIEIFCDRQGGRKRYSCVLAESLPDDWFDVLSETPSRSSYRRQRLPDLSIHFSVGGDSFPPTALASMIAKYLREGLMASINDFWAGRVANLKPTAGYPEDAKRFRAQIESTSDRLGYSIGDWWRAC